MRRQAAQVGMDRAEQWVALTDGGNGLDDFMEVNFPRAVRILDFYHAAEHLGDLAKADGEGDPVSAETLTQQWSHELKHVSAETLTQQWSHELKHEGGRTILATLEGLDWEGHSAAVHETHRLVSGYVRNHLDRMDYPRDRAAGWQIGSGHMEAACKTVVNQRLMGCLLGAIHQLML
jgi:hypothetical protein